MEKIKTHDYDPNETPLPETPVLEDVPLTPETEEQKPGAEVIQDTNIEDFLNEMEEQDKKRGLTE